MSDETTEEELCVKMDNARMNRIIRHRLRNLCAGVKMAVDRIAEQTSDIDPKIGEKCTIISSELNNLEEFSVRMDLLFDPLPQPDRLSLFEIVSLSRNFFIREFPFCTLDINGSEENITFAHGSWFIIVLKELLRNAGEAAGAENDVKVSWHFAPTFSIAIENDGEEFPVDIPTEPPQPFYTLKSRHDGLGLAIANRICMVTGSELTIHADPGKPVIATIKFSSEEIVNG